MIELGIDEMTIVIKATDETLDAMQLEEWPSVAGGIIEEFLGRTQLVSVYGDILEELRCPSGYTNAVTLGEHSFYLAIAFHERHPIMGVCVRISAQALAYYIENVGEPYLLLQSAFAPDCYSMHLSRCDIAVDYFDEGLDVTSIYRGLTSHELEVRREQMNTETGEVQERGSASKLSGYAISDKVPTFYLGSRKGNINALLRVYDKRLEQIETNGTKLERAQACNDWVRFEASLRHDYAKQFGYEMLEVADDEVEMLEAKLENLDNYYPVSS